MKRKHFLLGTLTIPLIVACSGVENTSIVNSDSHIDSPLDNILQSSIEENNSLVFGKSTNSENVPEKMTIIVNLGESQSLEFLLNNFDHIQQKFEKDEQFELLLVDLPSAEPELKTSDDLTMVLSSITMYTYLKSPEASLDFLHTALTRWENQETFVREDAVYMAQELELLPNIDISGPNAISEEYVARMTEKASRFTESTPAVLVNDSLWDGNVNNPIEVTQLFNPPA